MQLAQVATRPTSLARAVYAYFRKLTDPHFWEKINDELREELRIQLGRDPHLSVVVVDAQSVKTSACKI